MRQYGWLAGVVIAVAVLSLMMRPASRSSGLERSFAGVEQNLHIEGVSLGMSRTDVERAAGVAPHQGRSYVVYWSFHEAEEGCGKTSRWPHPEAMFSGTQPRPLGGVWFGRDGRAAAVFGQKLWRAEEVLAQYGLDAATALAAFPPRKIRDTRAGLKIYSRRPVSIYTREGKVVGVMLRGKRSKGRR
jgi:hypothetical protein